MCWMRLFYQSCEKIGNLYESLLQIDYTWKNSYMPWGWKKVMILEPYEQVQ